MNNSCTTRRISSIAIAYSGSDGLEFGDAERIAENNILGTTPEEIFKEMYAVASRNPRLCSGKWSLTGYVSPPKQIADKISSEELRAITLAALKRIGVTSENQYVLDIHNNSEVKHIHFTVNRVNTYGRCTVKAANVAERFGQELRKVCRERGLPTDVELSKEKKAIMLRDILKCLKQSQDFPQLSAALDELGYLVELSANEKDGVSGMRLAVKSEINHTTKRVYKSGFKLSEISHRLKVREIAEIFRLRETLSQLDPQAATLEQLQEFARMNGFEFSVRFSKEALINRIYVKPMEMSLKKDGYFLSIERGFRLSDLNPEFNQTILDRMNENLLRDRAEMAAIQDTCLVLDAIGEFFRPHFVSGGEDFRRKKRDIYDDPYLSY